MRLICLLFGEISRVFLFSIGSKSKCFNDFRTALVYYDNNFVPSQECSASVCLAKGYLSCQCPGSGWKDANLCRLCCLVNDTCSFAGDIPDLTEAKAFTGAPCNNFKGYCDVFHVCREVFRSFLFLWNLWKHNNMHYLSYKKELRECVLKNSLCLFPVCY